MPADPEYRNDRNPEEDLHFRVLDHLDRTPSTVSRVAREVGSGAEAVRRTIHDLKNRGLVEGVASGTTSPYTADVVYTTEDGHRVLSEHKQRPNREFFASDVTWVDTSSDEGDFSE